MVKRTGLNSGSSQPSLDDLAKEAEDELRRAGALGQPQRSMTPTRSMPQQRSTVPTPSMVPPDENVYGPDDPDDDDDYEYESWTPEEEARAVTNLAVQQLAERGYRPPTSQYRGASAPISSLSPEELRARAMAEMLERQRRLAQEHPVAPRSTRIVESPTVGARARAAPILTAAPMVNLPRASGIPRDSGARAPKGGSPLEGAVAPRVGQRGNFARRVDALKNGDGGEGGPAVDAGGTLVTARRGVTRRSTPRSTPSNGRRDDRGETADVVTSPLAGGGWDASPMGGGSSVDPQGALAGASHATLSAIAVLLASMEVLPAPHAGDADQSRLYGVVAQHMTRLSVLLERYLNALPPEWPEV